MIECVIKEWLSSINFECTNLQLKPLHMEMKMHINFCTKSNLDYRISQIWMTLKGHLLFTFDI